MRPLQSVETVRMVVLVALAFSLIACGGTGLSPLTGEPPDGSAPASVDGAPPGVPEASPPQPDGSAQPDGGAQSDGSAQSDAAPAGDSGFAPDSAGPDAGILFACKNPAPIVVGGKDTGYDSCQGGATRRRAVNDCPSLLPRPVQPACAIHGGGGCIQDSDCNTAPNGVCAPPLLGGGRCSCTYGCIQDSDCSAGNICVCADPVGTCKPATCTSKADCVPGAECADFTVALGCPAKSFACQTPADKCFLDSDCPPSNSCTVQNNARICANQVCVL